MRAEDRFPDDAVLRRVAAARPAIRRSRHTRRRPVIFGALGLVAAAACVALAIAAVQPGSSGPKAGSPNADRQAQAVLVHLQLTAAPVPLSRQHAMSRSPLGALIAREHTAVMLSLRTGDVAQNRKAIAQLTRNRKACVQAATAVQRAHARRGSANCSASGSGALACRRPTTGS